MKGKIEEEIINLDVEKIDFEGQTAAAHPAVELRDMLRAATLESR